MITKDVVQDLTILHCKKARFFSTHGWSKRVELNPWIINYAMIGCFGLKCCVVLTRGWVKYIQFLGELNPMAGFFLFWPNPTLFLQCLTFQGDAWGLLKKTTPHTYSITQLSIWQWQFREWMYDYQEFYCWVLSSPHSCKKDVIHMAGWEKDSRIIRMSGLLTVTSWVGDRILLLTIEEVSLTSQPVFQDHSASMCLWHSESEKYFSPLISVQSSSGQSVQG